MVAIFLKDVVGKLAMRSRARAGVCAPASDVEIITDVFPIQFHFGGFAELQIFPVSEMAEIFTVFDEDAFVGVVVCECSFFPVVGVDVVVVAVELAFV